MAQKPSLKDLLLATALPFSAATLAGTSAEAQIRVPIQPGRTIQAPPANQCEPTKPCVVQDTLTYNRGIPITPMQVYQFAGGDTTHIGTLQVPREGPFRITYQNGTQRAIVNNAEVVRRGIPQGIPAEGKIAFVLPNQEQDIIMSNYARELSQRAGRSVTTSIETVRLNGQSYRVRVFDAAELYAILGQDENQRELRTMPMIMRRVKNECATNCVSSLTGEIPLLPVAAQTPVAPDTIERVVVAREVSAPERPAGRGLVPVPTEGRGRRVPNESYTDRPTTSNKTVVTGIIGLQGILNRQRVVAEYEPGTVPDGFPTETEARTSAVFGGLLADIIIRDHQGNKYLVVTGHYARMLDGTTQSDSVVGNPVTQRYEVHRPAGQALEGGHDFGLQAAGRIPVGKKLGFVASGAVRNTQTVWPDGSTPTSTGLRARAGLEIDVSSSLSFTAGGMYQHMGGAAESIDAMKGFFFEGNAGQIARGDNGEFGFGVNYLTGSESLGHTKQDVVAYLDAALPIGTRLALTGGASMGVFSKPGNIGHDRFFAGLSYKLGGKRR